MEAPALFLEEGMEPYPGFRLTTFLGRGGWGEVWKAVRSDGEEFALKFLPTGAPHQATQEIRALQTIRQLVHPNLLRVENVWSCPHFLVEVMELAEGSLLDLLAIYQEELHTGFSQEHACFYLRQAALAIDFINARQHQVNGQRVAFRHCDIKPSNLLVIGDTVKVSDFSLAVLTTSKMGNHRRCGTPPYAAPEVHRGFLSERSDQYSLAVTYVMLRTRHFPTDSAPVKWSNGPGSQPANLSHLTPPERPTIARALSPVPQDRWPTCLEMMDRLLQACPSASRAG